jgi:1-deoxy-D-xylulose-5-phosphate reductoisomerase
MENIVLLGSTGSIGSSVIDVLRSYPSKFRLAGVSAHKNLPKLGKILREFTPELACLSGSPEENRDFISQFPSVEFVFGEDGLVSLAGLSSALTVVIGISGIAGLSPTLAAVKAGKRILSANKESIVAAGDIINSALSQAGLFIIPLDSEHNAIFNIYSRLETIFVKNISLTASGGPFLNKTITPGISMDEVLNHPVWEMGKTITVNSATLINKGFEVIEAHYLFHMDYERIKVLIHPQSLVHGIVETIDGTQFMACSPSDMRYPIALSLFYPEIPEQKFAPLDLNGRMFEFSKPDFEKFPLLKLSYEAGIEGGIMPAVLNAANETAVCSFLEGKIRFIDIPVIVRRVIDKYIAQNHTEGLTLEAILDKDREARIIAGELIAGGP